MSGQPKRITLLHGILDFEVIIFSFYGAHGIYWYFELGFQVRYGIWELFMFSFHITTIYMVSYTWRKLYETKCSLLNIEELQSIIEGTLLVTVIAFDEMRLDRTGKHIG